MPHGVDKYPCGANVGQKQHSVILMYCVLAAICIGLQED